jgi:hypothetical protein
LKGEVDIQPISIWRKISDQDDLRLLGLGLKFSPDPAAKASYKGEASFGTSFADLSHPSSEGLGPPHLHDQDVSQFEASMTDSMARDLPLVYSTPPHSQANVYGGVLYSDWNRDVLRSHDLARTRRLLQQHPVFNSSNQSPDLRRNLRPNRDIESILDDDSDNQGTEE